MVPPSAKAVIPVTGFPLLFCYLFLLIFICTQGVCMCVCLSDCLWCTSLSIPLVLKPVSPVVILSYLGLNDPGERMWLCLCGTPEKEVLWA